MTRCIATAIRSPPPSSISSELARIAAVSMPQEGEPIGAIAIYRTEVKPFSEKQIQFIDSSPPRRSSPIENTRLLNELRQRTDELGRSAK